MTRDVYSPEQATTRTATSIYEYTDAGIITKITDAENNEWRYLDVNELPRTTFADRIEVYEDVNGTPTLLKRITYGYDVEGRLIRVNPLVRWSKDDVRAFMREHKLPFHPRAARPLPEVPKEPQELPPSYNY